MLDVRHEPFGLTPLQRDLLLVIQELSDVGATLSTRELRDELGLRSLAHIHSVLKCLRDRRWIDWLPGRARSLRVLKRIPMPEESTFVGFFEDKERAREVMEGATG